MKKYVFILLIGLTLITGCSTKDNDINTDQVKMYFEDRGYTCKNDKFDEIDCTKKDDIYKEIVTFTSDGYISYSIETKEFKNLLIYRNMYREEEKELALTYNYTDDNGNNKERICLFASDSYYDRLNKTLKETQSNLLNDYYIKLKVGETVKQLEDEVCKDFTEEINSRLRKFEKFCSDNNIEL